ncbi:MAG: hypothetical protein ABF479_00020 [Gluconacetobacter sp.]|uniref:Uncharacterized protein n=1 Tax=Gluconacetobacter dulcium TaxID=2729096 RepID=A0A7W4K367_9PROT|nr:hypothetical protein [Gluconacetobacter dulcium]MBB2199529.1 hypothetical protein [Gluconacetobacter dulcium]
MAGDGRRSHSAHGGSDIGPMIGHFAWLGNDPWAVGARFGQWRAPWPMAG